MVIKKRYNYSTVSQSTIDSFALGYAPVDAGQRTAQNANLATPLELWKEREVGAAVGKGTVRTQRDGEADAGKPAVDVGWQRAGWRIEQRDERVKV